MAYPEGTSRCEAARARRRGALPYWRPLYDARRQERAMLDGQRYVDRNDIYNRDRRTVQVRGPQTSDANRHKIAVATLSPLHIDARPADETATLDDCERGVAMLEAEWEDPTKSFATTRQEVVTDAIDCRAGAALLHYDDQLGCCYWRAQDVGNIMFEPGFVDPHHIACCWMQVAVRMPIDQVRGMGKLKGKKKWKGVDDLVADGEVSNPNEGAQKVGSRIDGFSLGDLLGVPGNPTDDQHIWMLFEWIKYDRTAVEAKKASLALPPGERYMACDDPECGYQEPTAQELMDGGAIDSLDELPATEEEPCPECGASVSRRDYQPEVRGLYDVPPGRELVVLPLFQRTPNDEPCYQGEWPVQDCISFPIYWVTAYLRPLRPMGDSDTTRNWDQQVASDQMMTKAFTDMMRSQNIIVLPQDGLFDAEGFRFEMTDGQDNVAFADLSELQGPEPMVRLVQMSSLDPAWSSYWQAIQTVLTQYRGVTDFGLTPESTKDIPVGTAQALERQGEIPVAEFMKREKRALSLAADVEYCYLCATKKNDTPQLIKYDDQHMVMPMSYSSMPKLRFSVSEVEDFKGVDEARQRATQEIYTIARDDPDAIELFAAANKWPPGVVRAAEDYAAKRQQRIDAQAEQAQQGAVPELGALEPAPPDQGGLSLVPGLDEGNQAA